MTDLSAAFNDDKEFVGLVRYTPEFYLVRDSNIWIPVPADNPVLMEVELVDVSEDFIELFDKLEEKNSTPSYKQVQSYASPADEQDSTTE